MLSYSKILKCEVTDGAGGHLLACQLGGLCLFSGQSLWDLWWAESLGQVYSNYFSYALSHFFCQCYMFVFHSLTIFRWFNPRCVQSPKTPEWFPYLYNNLHINELECFYVLTALYYLHATIHPPTMIYKWRQIFSKHW
jgi:hypothetical protein